MTPLFNQLSLKINILLKNIDETHKMRVAEKSIYKHLEYLIKHDMFKDSLPLIQSEKDNLCFYSITNAPTHDKYSSAYKKNVLILPNGDIYRIHDTIGGTTLKKNNSQQFKETETDEALFSIIYETLKKPELSIMLLNEVIELFESKLNKEDHITNQLFKEIENYNHIHEERILLDKVVSVKPSTSTRNKNKI
jgi:hypothetical protein